MAKNKGGRPSKMTEITIKKLEEAFSLGCTDLEACFHAGITSPTLYAYQKENPAFLARKELLKDKLVLKSRMVISNAIDDNDEKTAQWYLERKKKDEFSTKHIAQVEGEINMVRIDKDDEGL